MNLNEQQLTEKEKNFCFLFLFGGAQYQYKPEECYQKAILVLSQYEMIETQKNPIKHSQMIVAGKRLIAKPHIRAYIKELLDEKHGDLEVELTREMIVDTAKNVMIEAANTTYMNEETGETVVPAQLRATSMKAAEVLMKVMPSVKDVDENNSTSGQATIVFKVEAQEEKKEDN